MSKRSELAEILKSEYGIGSVAELEKAIERLGSVDISLFCAEIKPTRRKRHEKEKSCPSEKILLSPEMVLRSPADRHDVCVPALAGGFGSQG